MRSLKIVSLNCFGIPVFVHKKQRFHLIAQELDRINPDIIALQEVFVWTNRQTLISKLQDKYNIYPNKYLPFSSGGLITFVKKNIKVDSFKFTKFTNQGSGSLIASADVIAGKGYQTFNLSVDTTNFNFVNCQMLCLYNSTNNLLEQYTSQLKQLKNDIGKLNTKSKIICGDLNTEPDSSYMIDFKDSLKLYELLGINDFSIAKDNLNRNKIMNLFTKKRFFRVDYVFVTRNIKITIQKIVFDKPFIFNNKPFHLSDHFGIFTEIEIG